MIYRGDTRLRGQWVALILQFIFIGSVTPRKTEPTRSDVMLIVRVKARASFPDRTTDIDWVGLGLAI